MRRVRQSFLTLVLLTAAGCASGESGADDQFRVRGAQFIQGAIPGYWPTSSSERTPRVTSIDTANLTVRQGQGAKPIAGHADHDASSIALALDGVSTGYWVVPTGVVDLTTNDLTWSVSTDFGQNIVPGRYALITVAIDDSGTAGDQRVIDLCVAGRVPDNGRACSDQAELPLAVVSLQ